MYRTQLEKNEIELTLKNKELLEKICQIDVLKAKYEEAIANVDPITSTVRFLLYNSSKILDNYTYFNNSTRNLVAINNNYSEQ